MNGYMTKERRNIYLVGEQWNFEWDEDEVHKAENMWRDGVSIQDMAKAFKRSPWEVFMMLHERLEIGAIGNREGGMFGGKPVEPHTKKEAQSPAKQRMEELNNLRATLTPERYQEERATGLNPYQIAKKYGMQYGSLQHRLRKWNLL